MVFCLPCQESARLCLMEAIRGEPFLQPADLGPTGRLSIPVQRRDKSSARWKSADQVAANSWRRS